MTRIRIRDEMYDEEQEDYVTEQAALEIAAGREAVIFHDEDTLRLVVDIKDDSDGS